MRVEPQQRNAHPGEDHCGSMNPRGFSRGESQFVKIQSQKESVFKWWIRIPLPPESVWVPIELPHEQEPLLRYDIRECKLLRDGARWFVNITL